MDVRLFSYWRSSSAYRVRIALHYKAVAFEYVSVNLLESAQKADGYRERAPTAQVPCLEISGSSFVESVAIFDLLDALFPSPRLYPADALQRARTLALVEVVNSGIQPLQNLVVLNRLPAPLKATWAHDFIARGLAAFEVLVAATAGRYSVGDTFSAADAFLIPQLYNARRFSVELGMFPTILRVEQEALRLPFVERAHPDRQPDAPVQS
jgi:maleylpyruvate isomerase